MILIYIYINEFIHIYIAYLAPKFKIVTQQLHLLLVLEAELLHL